MGVPTWSICVLAQLLAKAGDRLAAAMEADADSSGDAARVGHTVKGFRHLSRDQKQGQTVPAV